MNTTINHSGFIDMMLSSSDDFEPYGYDEKLMAGQEYDYYEQEFIGPALSLAMADS